jgi:chaperonin GroES
MENLMMSTTPNIVPLHDRLVVKQNDPETTTKGGIVIPDTAAEEKPIRGKVLAIGPGKRADDGKTIPLQVKVGDEVVFGKYAGTSIKLNGEEYLIMREEDVMGVLA